MESITGAWISVSSALREPACASVSGLVGDTPTSRCVSTRQSLLCASAGYFNALIVRLETHLVLQAAAICCSASLVPCCPYRVQHALTGAQAVPRCLCRGAGVRVLARHWELPD
jgi:hypothetical protein